jgi:hypothetical protein
MQQEDTSLIFCDLEKLMTVYRENCHGKPWERQMLTNQLYKLLEIYIAITNAEKKVTSNLSDEFCNTNSLLQGCPVSPTLLKICVDRALEEWCRKCK